MDISHPTLFSLGHKSRLKYKIIPSINRGSNKHSFEVLEAKQIKIAQLYIIYIFNKYKMTRTNKWTVHEAKSNSKWFTHHGPINCDPTKVKKLGAGKGNWGKPGDEIKDDTDMDMVTMFGQSQRRNSNHSQNEQDMKMLNEQLDHSMFTM